ncbi:MAG: GTPase Era [Patescibacteria group bacterium]|nr:GTPase Era [Patescibacteria group bacterium]
MKAGVVAIIGRPNTGKSTLLNAILGHKVSITSPKPQTTRFSIQAIFEHEKGQIIFIDTPGIFGKTHDILSKKINTEAERSLQNVDVIVYMVDHTRERDFEENKALGIVRKISVPKLLVINKIDVKHPTHIVQYRFMEEEFDRVIEISALKQKNISLLIQAIFDFLPEREKFFDSSQQSQPALNMTSKTFVAEIIREKAFLNLRKEVPYKITTIVDDIIERDSGSLYIKGRIITNDERYKPMIIGKNGSVIKEIGMATRKELETATNKRVFIDLCVEVDPHWMEYL